jgi:DNA (cytosine-5)-methyltransferase 1
LIKLTVGSLFSGIGGFELGLERSGGFETEWQCEIDPFCLKVLEKHWPNLQRFTDIKTMGIDNEMPYVDLICGGFPCQPVSCAGKRKGDEDDRWLWPEFYRIVCLVKPSWVVVENVPGLLSAKHGQLFGGILTDLAKAGYDAEWQVLSAAQFGAPHLRKRVFIVAHSNTSRLPSLWIEGRLQQTQGQTCSSTKRRSLLGPEWITRGRSIISGLGRTSDGVSERLDEPGRCAKRNVTAILIKDDKYWIGTNWCETPQNECPRITGDNYTKCTSICKQHSHAEIDVLEKAGNEASGSVLYLENHDHICDECKEALNKNGVYQFIVNPWGNDWEYGTPRLATGQKQRVNRLKALGNAIVPQVAEYIGKCIMEYYAN